MGLQNERAGLPKADSDCLNSEGGLGEIGSRGSGTGATWSSLLHSRESAPCHSPIDSKRQKASLRLLKKNEAQREDGA